MVPKQSPKFLGLKIARTFLIVGVALLASYFIVYAATFNISTTDTSASEWEPVGVFQTDPTGDFIASPDGLQSANDDIIVTKVATGPAGGSTGTDLYFYLKVAGTSALSTQYHIPIAYVDCDADGPQNGPYDEWEQSDRMIIYRPAADDVQSCEGVPPGYGVSQSCIVIPDAGPITQQYGQRPSGDPNVIEWRMPINMLPPDDYSSANCRGTIRIHFFTAYNNPSQPLNWTIIDRIDIGDGTYGPPYRLYNAPTVVTLEGLSARNEQSGFANGILVLAALGVGLILLTSSWLLVKNFKS